MTAAILCALAILQPIQRLDLDQDAARQVIVDREPGQYLGHVSTVLCADGSILAAYPKGHGKGAIILKRSRDGGRTWSERLPTPASFATSLETPTVFSLGITDHAAKPSTDSEHLVLFSGLFPIRAAHSFDAGATWTELEKIGDYGGIVAMGGVLRTVNGELVAFFHDDGRFIAQGGKSSGTFTLYQVASKDEGRTWSMPSVIWTGSDVHLCEPGVIRSPDRSTIALLLRENRRMKHSHVMFSRDEARTWSAPRELPGPLTGDRHTARYAPDGRLVVTFRDMAPNSPSKGDWVVWVGSWDDITDETASRPGQYLVRLKDNTNAWDCGYPGLELLSDGVFVATTYGHWEKGEQPYILSVRFTLAELDELARAASPAR